MHILLADCIRVFHIAVILFVIVAPFVNSPAVLVLHITFSVCLLVHWISNNNTCSLTLLECHLRGVKPSHTFSHQFIAPMYDVSATDWSALCYVVTLVAMFWSVSKLRESGVLSKISACWNGEKSIAENAMCMQRVLMGLRG